MRSPLAEAVVCIVGLGYVGLPLAKAVSSSLKVIGFDTNVNKVNNLVSQLSDTGHGPVGWQATPSSRPSQTISAITTDLIITANPKEITKADFILKGLSAPGNLNNEGLPRLSLITTFDKCLACCPIVKSDILFKHPKW